MIWPSRTKTVDFACFVSDDLIQNSTGSCNYCGCPIDTRLYFCPGCAKPFRPVEHVLPASAVKYEDDEIRLRTGAPQAWNVFFIYLIVMCIAAFLALSIWGRDNMEAVFLVSDGALAITTAILAAYHWSDLRPLLARVLGLIHPACWLGLTILAPLLALNYGYHHILTGWLDAEPENFTDYFSSAWGPVIFICIMPAISEEIAFRGIVQHQFEKVVKPSIAIGIAALVFSAAHLNVLSAPYLALVGALLGWMKLKTNSLYPPMLAHFLHNYIVVTYF